MQLKLLPLHGQLQQIYFIIITIIIIIIFRETGFDIGDNLHEMSNSVSWGNKKLEIIEMSSAENISQHITSILH